jgi:sulfhydrogenase subunit gamma (sulfur reductase)
MRIQHTTVETADQVLKSFDLAFENPMDREAFFSTYCPGQFCQLSIFGKGEAPFGVALADPGSGLVRFTINKIGVFTRAMHALPVGHAVGLRGPLGNGYPLEHCNGADVLIVGGGYAFTTLYALTRHLLSSGNDRRPAKLTVLYGAREPDLFLYKDETRHWHDRDDIDFHQAIDRAVEGWPHHVGLVPTVLKQINPAAASAVAFICGPPVMIRFTLPVLKELEFAPDRIFTSMEKRMKCGIGKCGRCNIGPDYICADGPVFSLSHLNQLPKDL